MRANYWSCSKFADWLRGTAKPSAETSKGWRLWNKAAKETHPIRYWIVEEGFDHLQNFVHWIPDRINDIRYYLNNRFLSVTHGMISRSLEPGKWHEFETRLLHSAFDQLVDFVEIEQAWHHVLWDNEARTKFQTPWWRKQWWSRWFIQWRCPEAGVEHLEWAAGLNLNDFYKPGDPEYDQPSPQALAARETLELYNWWKYDRPARPDPYDESGWHDICDRRRQSDGDFLGGDETPAERKETTKSLKIIDKLEKQYDQEDEEMLIRLIKIRKSLWT